MASRPPARRRSTPDRPAPARAADAPRRSASATRGPARMAFERRNYVLLLLGLGLVAAGYALMAVDNARGMDEAGRHMLSLGSPISLVLAPLLLLAGYLGIVYAVLWRPRPTAEARPAEATA